MDVEATKSRLHSLAFGEAMLAAATDYKKEVEASHRSGPAAAESFDIEELLDDPELERLHAERLATMQREVERRVKMERTGHGSLTEAQEGDFLEITTTSPHVVCHFFHRDFERCKIMDKHLEHLAKKYFDTRFIKLSAPDAPFFTLKLQVKMLPCVIMFNNGVAMDRVVGFGDLGGDHFTPDKLETRLLKSGVLVVPKGEGSDDEGREPELVRRNVRKGFQKTESDEDSDFD